MTLSFVKNSYQFVRIIVEFGAYSGYGLFYLLLFLAAGHFVLRNFLFHDDGVESAFLYAGAAFYTGLLIYKMFLFQFTRDRLSRAHALTRSAAHAVIFYYSVFDQGPALFSRAFFINNMIVILIVEIVQRGKNGIRSRLSKTA